MSNHKKVIPFPSPPWRFFDYLEGEADPVEDWYQSLSEEGRDLFDAMLKANSHTDSPENWNELKFLKGGDLKEQRVWELRFFADAKQQRVFGIFGDERKKAVFLVGCYHKGGNYTPTDALSTAARRAKAVKKGASLRERKIRQDF